jgi:ribose-phosphate pyrophosphokinase
MENETTFIPKNQITHEQERNDVEILYDDNNVIMATGTGNPELARKTAHYFGKEATDSITHFANGELRVKIQETLRNKYVVLFQSPTNPQLDSHIMELGGMIRASRLGGAKEIIAIVSNFPYGRSDRKDVSRTAPMGGLVAEIFQLAGAKRLISFNLHSEQLQLAVGILPWDNVYAEPDLLDSIEEHEKVDFSDVIFLSTDAGGLKAQQAILTPILGNFNHAMAFKYRDPNLTNNSTTYGVWSDRPFNDRTIIVTDDMIDTGGSICAAAKTAIDQGASHVIAMAPHGIFSIDNEGKHPLDKMRDIGIERVYVTNTHSHDDEVCKKAIEKGFLKEVDVSRRLAEVIHSNLVNDGSVSNFLYERYSRRNSITT